MNVLVMAPEPVDADTVKGALGTDDLGDANILYVSPALNESAVAFWVSDSDEAITEARQRAEKTEEALSEAGAAKAKGVTGESEPLLALQDALATFDADRIVVFVRPDDEQRYREDDVVGEAERRFSVPVTQAAL